MNNMEENVIRENTLTALNKFKRLENKFGYTHSLTLMARGEAMALINLCKTLSIRIDV